MSLFLGHSGLGSQDSMLQRPPASRPASRSRPDPQKLILTPVQLRDELQQGGRESGRQQLDAEGGGYPQRSPRNLPTGRPVTSGDNWGLHSILNPTEPDNHGFSSRGLCDSTSESSSSGVGPGPQFPGSASTATPHTFSCKQSISGTTPTTESYGGTLPRIRKILTPTSLSRGTPDTRRSHFLPSWERPYTADLGLPSDMLPMTTPSGYSQQDYGFLPTATPTIGRMSEGIFQAAGHAPLSQSASPSVSTPTSQTSSASYPYQKGPQAPQTATPCFPVSPFGTAIQKGRAMQFRGASAAPESPYGAQAPPQAQEDSSLHSSRGGNSRQTSASDPMKILTITTCQGQYTVPADVRQASRLADERRARRAGASVRFRQRRKEMEKEASANIVRLYQQTRDLERRIRELEQERDFYRAERDRFREVISRTPETRNPVIQAPHSPRTMRPV